MSVERLNARDDLLMLATLYEDTLAIDLLLAGSGGSGVGPRTPPGARLALNVDELLRARADVDDWIGYCTSIVASDVDDHDEPELTPARLRYVGEHADVMLEQDEPAAVVYFKRQLQHHLRVFRGLSQRGERRVPTGFECQRPGCGGQLVSNLGGVDGTDSALRCEECGREVPMLVWQHWPRAQEKFVTPEHAARLLGIPVSTVRVHAHRRKWRRVGTGRDVRYLLDDVWGERGRA